MRHLTFLLIAIVSLVAPANLFAQSERPAQASKPAQSNEATQVSPSATPTNNAAGTTQTRQAYDFFKFVSNQRPGTYLRVRMKSTARFQGERAEAGPTQFVLIHRGQLVFIPYKDVASIKVGKTFWQQVGRVAMWPIQGAKYAVIIPYYLCAFGVVVLIDKIRGRDRWN